MALDDKDDFKLAPLPSLETTEIPILKPTQYSVQDSGVKPVAPDFYKGTSVLDQPSNTQPFIATMKAQDEFRSGYEPTDFGNSGQVPTITPIQVQTNNLTDLLPQSVLTQPTVPSDPLMNSYFAAHEASRE
jgi:hypothetical protein